MRKDYISDKYRRRVDKLLEDPSGPYLSHPLSQEEEEILWEEICTEMDLSEVWEAISSGLDHLLPVQSGLTPLVKTAWVLLILTIGLIPVRKEMVHAFREQPGIKVNNPQAEMRTETAKTDATADRGLSLQWNVPDGRGQDIGPVGADPETTPLYQSASESEEMHRPAWLNGIPPENSGVPPEIHYDGLERYGILSSAGRPSPLKALDRISVGLISLYKNTWLLNNVTFDGFRSESPHTSVIVFCFDAGLSVNYAYRNNWSFQGDGFFYSNTGQEYIQHIEGQYLRKSVSLKYSTLAFSVKYGFSGKESVRDRFVINAMAGAYLSVLHHARQVENSDPQNIDAQYARLDYGVKLGGELELYLSDHLSIAPGLLLTFGIPNIFKGDERIPYYFRKTHNGSAGFQLVLYYSF